MAHIHSVYDSNEHFVIDPVTRAIANSLAKKIVVMQFDHNSERFTFEIPKLVDGHNMANCDRVEIHYINVDAADKTLKSTGVYEVKDIDISPDNDSMAVFSWLLSRNCTKYAGTLSFLIHFACTKGGIEEYAWNTAIFQSITIGNGMNNGEEVVEPFPDILAQWKADLFGVGDTQEQRLLTVSQEQQAAIAAKGAAVLDSIPDEYEALQAGIDTLFNSVASGIRGNISGAVVMADDVSPVKHSPIVWVHGKNLFNGELLNGVFLSNSFSLDAENGSVFKSIKVYLTPGTYTVSFSKKVNIVRSIIDGAYAIVGYVVVNEHTFTVTTNGYVGFTFRDSTSIDTEWNDATVIQIEIGETATEYTPYIDPATVTVKRCGKNLISYPYKYGNNKNNGVEFTVFSNGVIGMNGTSTDYAVFYVDSEGIELENGVAYDVVQPITKKAGLVLNYTDENGKSSWISSSIVWKSGYTYKGLYIQIDPDVTIDENFVPIIKRTRDPLESYIPAADGTVSGMTSLSPCMTVLTDTDGAIVECEYIVDTKTYIDNKIKELMEGSE